MLPRPIAPIPPRSPLDIRSTALVRPVAPVPAAERVETASEHVLSRAGVDLAKLFGEVDDALVTRATPTATALTDQLERARAALVRGAPDAALSALDEGWDGAARTESGWYYRSAALALLGLPEDAERVLADGLTRRPQSAALLFLQSVIRSEQGDSAGARGALLAAMARRPGQSVLLAWQAVLSARAGDAHGALDLLAPLFENDPTSAVFSWAKQAIMAAKAERARASDPSSVGGAPTDADVAVHTEADRARAAAAASATDEGLDPSQAPLSRALARLGALLGERPVDEVRREIRTLIQALALGGTLDRSAKSAEIAAVRSVLSDLLRLLERASATPALGRHALDPLAAEHEVPEPPAVRAAILHALSRGRFEIAERLMARLAQSERDASAGVLRVLVQGARSAARDLGASAVSEPPESVAELLLRTATRREHAVLVPVRVGLSLLNESSARQSAHEVMRGLVEPLAASSTGRAATWGAAGAIVGGAFSGSAVPNPSELSPHARLVGGGELVAAHLAANASVAASVRRTQRDASLHAGASADASARTGAVVCVGLALVAFVFGRDLVGLLCAAGAGWFVLRRSLR